MRKRMYLAVVLMVSLCLAAEDPNGVIFELNATQPGNAFWKQWQPTIGVGPGTLRNVGDVSFTPVLMSEDDGNGNYRWYYRFTAQTDGSAAGTFGGYATGYGMESVGDFKLDPRGNYTIEVWLRRPGIKGLASNWGEQIIGNYNLTSGTGWHLTTVGIGTGHTWARMQARIRDNSGDNKVDQGITSYSLDYAVDPTLWHHVVITWDGSTPAGLIAGVTYLDGQANFAHYNNLASPPAISQAYWDSSDVDVFGGDEVRVGVAYNSSITAGQLWFNGDIALIKVYDGVMTASAVSDNYLAGPPTSPEPSPTVLCTGDIVGDLNSDCMVNFEDLSMLALSWLDCNLDPQTACFN